MKKCKVCDKSYPSEEYESCPFCCIHLDYVEKLNQKRHDFHNNLADLRKDQAYKIHKLLRAISKEKKEEN